ncbi:MAG: FAD synthase [Candidatus Thermoplasmatota archaeon]|nr:FAD synthase [Candidatus Thermoplasmatota archaeon]
MVRVLATGVFDIIHLGHLHYFEESKKLGDELVVIVATDNTARKRKHEPITPEAMRLELVQGLKPVDRAVLGKDDADIFEIVTDIKPDIITIGFDQTFEPEQMEADLKSRGIDVRVVRMPHLDHDLDGTRKIIRKVIEFHNADKKLSVVEKR